MNPSRQRGTSEGENVERNPMRKAFPTCCAPAANGVTVTMSASTTASPISRIVTSVGMSGGSLAERRDVHQHRAAGARHPDPIDLDCAVQRAVVFMLEDEGFERDAEGGGHRQPLRTAGVSQRESRLAWLRRPRA